MRHHNRWLLSVMAAMVVLGTALGAALPLDKLPGARPVINLVQTQRAAEGFMNAPVAAFVYRDLEQEMNVLRLEDQWLLRVSGSNGNENFYWQQDGGWRYHDGKHWQELPAEKRPAFYPVLDVGREQMAQSRYLMGLSDQLVRYCAKFQRDELLAQDMALYGIKDCDEAEAVYDLNEGALEQFTFTLHGTRSDGRPAVLYYQIEAISTDQVTVRNQWAKAMDELSKAAGIAAGEAQPAADRI